MTKTTLSRLPALSRYAVISMALGLMLLPAACVHDSEYYGPPRHYHYYPHYHDYYFYPSARVYFHFTTGTYYYLDGTVWVKTRVLPPHIRIDARHRVKLRIDSDRPYTKFNQHIDVYRPRPNYRAEVERSRREKEANQKWFKEYQREKQHPGQRGGKVSP